MKYLRPTMLDQAGNPNFLGRHKPPSPSPHMPQLSNY